MTPIDPGLAASAAGLVMTGSAFLLPPPASATPISTARPCEYVVATNGSDLNVRTGPGLRYRVIGSLPNRSRVVADCRATSGWVKIREGRFADRGWVARWWLDRAR